MILRAVMKLYLKSRAKRRMILNMMKQDQPLLQREFSFSICSQNITIDNRLILDVPHNLV
jgi:hypothetical protein